jgi:outer membrane protein assembly factor BamB
MLHRRFLGHCVIGALLAGLWLAAPESALGQVMVAPTAVDEVDASNENAPKGFGVLKADSKIVEMLDDFDRYAAKKSWELAFRSLNSLNDTGNKGMVPTKNGFFVPIRARAQQSLLNLPPEGREAYRLFNDAAAKQLWDRLQNTQGGFPSDEMATLRKLVDQYFLTSVGDLAADRLGDALFEQGEFAAADGMWRLVVEKYPDPHLSPAKLQVKRAVALARLGRGEALEALSSQIAEQYADDRVTVGGHDVKAAEFVKSLAPKQASNGPARVAAADAMLLPTADEPLWQIRLGAVNTRGRIDPNTGMPMGDVHATSNCAVEGNRLYANWLGTVFAADLETGKMLWRTGRFSNAVQSAMNLLQQGMSTDCFCLSATGGKLVVLRPPVKNLLGELLGGDVAQDGMLALECLDAATGKTLWRAPRLNMAIVSAPYLLDGAAYYIAISNNSTMNLVATDLSNGRQLWTAQLGTPQNANNWRGGYSFGGPKILFGGGFIYVATNNGALLAVGMASHQVEWALQHDTRPLAVQNRFWFNGMMVVPSETPGTLLDGDGLFYLKDTNARLMYALDPSTPSLQWKRPISSDESIATIDGQTAYLVGNEISALDLKSRKLLWSTKLPQAGATPMPLIVPDHVYVPTSRGIFDLDPANGDIRRVFRGADRESGSSRLLLAGDKLISMSDTALTAYSVQRAKPTKVTSRPSKENRRAEK